MLSDNFNVLLLSNEPHLKLPFEVLEACVYHREASSMWALHLSITIRFLPDSVDHILCCRWEDVIERKVPAAITYRHLGTRCAISLLATINDAKMCWDV